MMTMTIAAATRRSGAKAFWESCSTSDRCWVAALWQGGGPLFP
jgi:hypothetical protein